jgi:hypothetical protein
MVFEDEKRNVTRSAAADTRVSSALKAAVEINLARERALTSVVTELPGAWHSNGVIFSKSGNGTPFSNGIIFSKTGRAEITAAGDPEAHLNIVQQLSELDEAAFTTFTDRLLKLKQVKAIRGPSGG